LVGEGYTDYVQVVIRSKSELSWRIAADQAAPITYGDWKMIRSMVASHEITEKAWEHRVLQVAFKLTSLLPVSAAIDPNEDAHWDEHLESDDFDQQPHAPGGRTFTYPYSGI
jgi:hypothetical protein